MNIKILSVVLLMGAVVFCSPNAFSQSRHLFSVIKNNALADNCCRVGFIDEEGKLKIGFKFYYASEFREGLSAVRIIKNGKWGYADETGRIVIKPQFES